MDTIRENLIEYQQQYEAIDAPERIFSLLKPAIDNDASLSIAADKSGELFHTNLLHIDFNRKILALKQIDYTFGHLMVIDAKSLTVYSRRDGAEITFSTYLSRYSEKNGGFYELRFPEKVKYCQRRKSHRIHTSFALGITAEIYNEHGEKIEAQLRDISIDGLRLQLSTVNPDEFKEKSLIKNCVISLPNNQQINCALQIQHRHNHARNKGCTIGGSFFEMSMEQKKAIQKFIAGLERRLLREVRL